MNRKGFTLIELLAVIAILGMLVAIISPVVTNLINDSKDSLSKNQVDMIITASKKYMIDHSGLLMNNDGPIFVSITDLINSGVIDNDKVVDPKTKKVLNGCVKISYSDSYNQYEYNYVNSCS